MSESVIIFSREWLMTTALTALLTPAYVLSARPVYGPEQLVRTLREHPRTPLVLGLCLHEHVADLYRLQPLLTRRAVLFVSRRFYWTDYKLPEWLGLEQYGFCSWDTMLDPFSRQMKLRRLWGLSADGNDDNVVPLSIFSSVTEIQLQERVNRWLHRELSVAGLTEYEIQVLSLMTEGHRGDLPPQVRSVHKNNGLNKLGMTKHVMNLYRGVKVRPELQAGLLSGAGESVTEI
ncbi:hypothetical protein NB12_003900 [Salmonella enterica subsp. enterica serovar Pomona]|nr:hypothetical protein [Salmonella enterica subsp. enterica serovar Pomona]